MCECVKQIDKEMASKNGRVLMALVMSNDMSEMNAYVTIATEKVDKKKRSPVPTLVATYCPFCGVKL